MFIDKEEKPTGLTTNLLKSWLYLNTKDDEVVIPPLILFGITFKDIKSLSNILWFKLVVIVVVIFVDVPVTLSSSNFSKL